MKEISNCVNLFSFAKWYRIAFKTLFMPFVSRKLYRFLMTQTRWSAKFHSIYRVAVDEKVFREIYTVEFFFQSISWNIVLGLFHETWNTFMKYFYFSIQHSLRMFLINKKIVFSEKRYCVKNSKIPKHIWMKPRSKTRSGKSTCANIFLELPLTI